MQQEEQQFLNNLDKKLWNATDKYFVHRVLDELMEGPLCQCRARLIW